MQVVMGAQMLCSFGTAPAALVVARPNCACSSMGMANIMDCVPVTNIPPFAMCTNPANPTVASATAAACGVLTPMPCLPVTVPWAPGKPQVLVGGMPALDMNSKCTCSYGGVISIVYAGQATTLI